MQNCTRGCSLKEFISSSQTAARLVFNINNCVDLSKVLQLRPNRPPDAKGRESFVYIMDGAVVRSIKDLPIDELTPWNSKKCKSSTRFSSVQFDAEKNSLVFNRYIISDAANVERPECLIVTFLNEEELLFKVEDDLFRPEDGLLNSLLSFEQFARRLHIMEKGWPSGFRMWFREKSGWIYERCSLVARIKAGFTKNDALFDMSEALAPLKETLRQNLSATLEEFCDSDPNSALQNAISTAEQVFTDLLIRAVHSVISSTNDQSNSYSVRLHPAKAHFWIGSPQWAQLSAQERRECLSNLGLSALSAAGTLSANSFDPLIFTGLSRSQKMDLLSRANALDVLSLVDNAQKKRFVVEDVSGQRAFYVCNESRSVQCQCQPNGRVTSRRSLSHLKTTGVVPPPPLWRVSSPPPTIPPHRFVEEPPTHLPQLEQPSTSSSGRTPASPLARQLAAELDELRQSGMGALLRQPYSSASLLRSIHSKSNSFGTCATNRLRQAVESDDELASARGSVPNSQTLDGHLSAKRLKRGRCARSTLRSFLDRFTHRGNSLQDVRPSPRSAPLSLPPALPPHCCPSPCFSVHPPISQFVDWDCAHCSRWLTEVGFGDALVGAVRSGRHLLSMLEADFETELGVRSALQRKRLKCMLDRIERNSETEAADKMDTNMVMLWLDQIGLPQLRDSFAENHVNGHI
uniref:SAM domain-containing protein n=1 Tax=Globodera pallida TaxID=36090 RepID=A0A183CDS3_GLOPA